jgi:hypothetical protein
MIPQNSLPVVPSMKGLERRQTSRKTVERFAYINIEPGNGGSVLNVSEGGLCFRSVAPVERNKAMRLWFWDHDRRIEIQGDLVWMNERLKTGGLRFTDLPVEAREPMRKWISPALALAPDQETVLSALRPHVSPPPGDNWPETRLDIGRSEQLAVILPKTTKAPLSSFAGGMAAGLLVAALVAAPFLFRSYKHQLGESLIYWGELFAARPHAQTQSVTPQPQSIPPSTNAQRTLQAPSTEPQTSRPSAEAITQEPQPEPKPTQNVVAVAHAVLPPPATIPPPEKVMSNVASDKAAADKARKQADSHPERIPSSQTQVPQIAPASPTPATSIAMASRLPQAAAAISTAGPTIASPAATVAPNSKVAPAKPGVPQLEPAAGIVQNTAKANGVSNSQLYFEIGKFKNEMLAKGETDKLVRLGFRATTAEKKHLWSTSYHLLVGPYNDDQAEGIRNKLLASGFKPQVFERGSRGFNIGGGCETMGRLLRSEPAANRIQMPAEGCVISWETYSNFAMVKFGAENNIVATANGRWVNRAITYPRDAFVYRVNDDGSRTLLEIQFAGMSHALVFGKS